MLMFGLCSSLIVLFNRLLYIKVKVFLTQSSNVILILCFFWSSGTKMIPADFLAPIETHNPVAGGIHHKVSSYQF